MSFDILADIEILLITNMFEKPSSKPISLKSLRISDFTPPIIAFLAFFVYQYLAPQYYFPFLLKLHIAMISVSFCIFFAIIGWNNNRVKYSSPVIWSVIILAIIFFLARYFVQSPQTTKFYFDEHFHSIAVGLVMLYHFRDANKINLLIVCLIMFATFDAFIAIKEGGLIWGHDFLQDENQISALLSMTIPVTIFYSLYIKKRFSKILCYIAIALQLAEVVVSVSRGGFVALVSISFCMLTFTKKKILFIVLIIVAIIGILQFAPDKFFSEMATLREGTEESTARARTEYWRRATIMFTENPLFGKGINQFASLSYKYILPGKTPNEGDYLVCHSNWFQILSELGIAGVILYFIIFYYFFNASYLVTKKYKKEGELYLAQYEYSFYWNVTIGLTIGMIGFMVAGSFINILIFPYFYTYLFLMMLVKSTFLDKVHAAEAYLKNAEAHTV
jgi:probable O-glycosylation ligase (exosortase A-associated)